MSPQIHRSQSRGSTTTRSSVERLDYGTHYPGKEMNEEISGKTTGSRILQIKQQFNLGLDTDSFQGGGGSLRNRHSCSCTRRSLHDYREQDLCYYAPHDSLPSCTANSKSHNRIAAIERSLTIFLLLWSFI
eukprot:sb/3475083/